MNELLHLIKNDGIWLLGHVLVSTEQAWVFWQWWPPNSVVFATCTVYPKKYAHGFVVLCFVVVMQSFIMNSHEVFIHIHQGCFAGTGAIVRLPQYQWSKPDGYGKISQCITTTKHSKAKTVCIFLWIYCYSNGKCDIQPQVAMDMFNISCDMNPKWMLQEDLIDDAPTLVPKMTPTRVISIQDIIWGIPICCPIMNNMMLSGRQA